MKTWLVLLLTALAFTVVLVGTVMAILHSPHGAKAKSRDAPHPTAAPQPPVEPVERTRSAVPALGLYVAETARDTVFLPESTGKSLPAPHDASDGFGHHVRMSADGTTLLEIYRRGGDVTFKKKNDDETNYEANNSLIFYRRKDDAWQPYTANMASKKFTSYFPNVALGANVSTDGQFGNSSAHCFDVSGEATYAAVQWRLPDSNTGAVALYKYNGDGNYSIDQDRRSNHVLRMGPAGVPGDNFGKVVRFLGDKRLMVSADLNSRTAIGGAVRIYRAGTDPEGPIFVQSDVDTDIVAPLGEEKRSFGDACAGDANATTVWVSSCNSEFSRVYAYQRESEDKEFGPPTLTFDLGLPNVRVNDIALSDPADYCAVAHDGHVFIFARREAGGTAYVSEPVQTLFAPPLIDYKESLGFGASVRMSKDARVLAVGCAPSSPRGNYRSYVFVYRLDPETGRYAEASTANGDPQYLAGTAGSAVDFNLTATGDAATLLRGVPEAGELHTYHLA